MHPEQHKHREVLSFTGADKRALTMDRSNSATIVDEDIAVLLPSSKNQMSCCTAPIPLASTRAVEIALQADCKKNWCM